MTVYELNRDQLEELKANYLMEKTDERGESPSWGDLADADNIISDHEIFAVYDGTEFSNDDFSCSAGQDEDGQYHLEVSGDGDKYNLASDLRQIADDIENGYYSGIANYGSSWSIEI